LEQIRDSLRPFEQAGNAESAALPSPFCLPNNNSSEDEERRQIMINTLTQIGFDEDFRDYGGIAQAGRSTAAAAPPSASSLYSGINGPVYNNMKLTAATTTTGQTGAAANTGVTILNTQMSATSVLASVDDSSSSRSNSPLARIPSPPAAATAAATVTATSFS
uniref:CG14226 n=1 Tax=Gongylonema pulchrum TaxID=637853 RepID=A0A183E9A0_9BILA